MRGSKLYQGCRDHAGGNRRMVTSVYWSTIATRTALAVLAVMLSTGYTVRAQDKGTSRSASRCRRSPSPTIRRRRPRSCSAARRRRRRWRRAPSASMPKAASPARVALPINGKTWQVMRALAQPQLGPSGAGAISRAAGRQGAARPAGPGFSSATCRSRAAARCSPAYQPSGRPRRRYLAHARCPTASSRGQSART